MTWKWRVTLRYDDTAEWPKRPGAVALQTLHVSDASKDAEVNAAEARGDVTIEVENLAECEHDWEQIVDERGRMVYSTCTKCGDRFPAQWTPKPRTHEEEMADEAEAAMEREWRE